MYLLPNSSDNVSPNKPPYDAYLANTAITINACTGQNNNICNTISSDSFLIVFAVQDIQSCLHAVGNLVPLRLPASHVYLHRTYVYTIK